MPSLQLDIGFKRSQVAALVAFQLAQVSQLFLVYFEGGFLPLYLLFVFFELLAHPGYLVLHADALVALEVELLAYLFAFLLAGPQFLFDQLQLLPLLEGFTFVKGGLLQERAFLC